MTFIFFGLCAAGGWCWWAFWRMALPVKRCSRLMVTHGVVTQPFGSILSAPSCAGRGCVQFGVKRDREEKFFTSWFSTLTVSCVMSSFNLLLCPRTGVLLTRGCAFVYSFIATEGLYGVWPAPVPWYGSISTITNIVPNLSSKGQRHKGHHHHHRKHHQHHNHHGGRVVLPSPQIEGSVRISWRPDPLPLHRLSCCCLVIRLRSSRSLMGTIRAVV